MEEKAAKDKEIMEKFVTPTRNYTEIETRFLELFMEECMQTEGGGIDSLEQRLNELYSQAEKSDFDWEVKNWDMFEDEDKEESDDEGKEDESDDEIEELNLSAQGEGEEQNLKQDL